MLNLDATNFYPSYTPQTPYTGCFINRRFAVIRPILEYACTVLNHNLTSTHEQLESYLKEHCKIIYGDQSKGMPYSNALSWLIWSPYETAEIKLANLFL